MFRTKPLVRLGMETKADILQEQVQGLPCSLQTLRRQVQALPYSLQTYYRTRYKSSHVLCCQIGGTGKGPTTSRMIGQQR